MQSFYHGKLNELASIPSEYDEVFCLGDVNIDVSIPDSCPSKKLFSMLGLFLYSEVPNTNFLNKPILKTLSMSLKLLL